MIEIIGNIEKGETIAEGKGIKIRRFLNEKYGCHQWKKKKGLLESKPLRVISFGRRFTGMKLTVLEKS